ncbi:hypothetical protein RIF29_24832 [Crotalaria pallida]|uniref:Uncharacterized protein n=1 Tax=Crotalaria pallida TaxID=3830 RepID=A0AAN9EMX9_CROPI
MATSSGHHHTRESISYEEVCYVNLIHKGLLRYGHVNLEILKWTSTVDERNVKFRRLSSSVNILNSSDDRQRDKNKASQRITQSSSSSGRLTQSKKRDIHLIEIDENKENQLSVEFNDKNVQHICCGVQNPNCSKCYDGVQSVEINNKNVQDICSGVQNLKCFNYDDVVPSARSAVNNQSASDEFNSKHVSLRIVQAVKDGLRTVDNYSVQDDEIETSDDDNGAEYCEESDE